MKECKPWAGDVVEEATVFPSKKSVSFSDDDEKLEAEKEVQVSSQGPEKSGHEVHPNARPSNALTESYEWAREESDSGIDV